VKRKKRTLALVTSCRLTNSRASSLCQKTRSPHLHCMSFLRPATAARKLLPYSELAQLLFDSPPLKAMATRSSARLSNEKRDVPNGTSAAVNGTKEVNGITFQVQRLQLTTEMTGEAQSRTKGQSCSNGSNGQNHKTKSEQGGRDRFQSAGSPANC